MGIEADPLPWSGSMPRLLGTGGLWWVGAGVRGEGCMV